MQINISHIPEQPGVYLFKDSKDKVLYIGKAKNLQKRVSQYFAPNSLWKQEMLHQASKVDFFVVANESESLYLENNLIKKYKPFFNCMLKGGNGYTYIKMTDSMIPQVLTTRMKKQDKSVYIGPKHNTKELKKLLQYLRSVLKYRTCKTSQFSQGNVCSDFYFGLCEGWCTKCKFKENIEDYQKRLQILTSFFKGNTKPIEKEMINQIENAAKNQNFEWAAQVRDMYLHIEQLVEKQHVELGKNLTGYVLAIKEISGNNISILLNFYEGKLIDIIRQENPIDDGDVFWISAGIEAECGDFFIQSEDSFEGCSKFALLSFSKGVSFNKEERLALFNMLERFFDSYVVSSSLQGPGIQNNLLSLLQKRYHFKNFPNCVECLDISHMNGDWISGGLSCIVGGLPEKKRYRKYKIKTVSGHSDDYASLKEVLKRRFIEKVDLPDFPDVFVLDGGIGQLNVVKDLCKESGVFSKIAKRVDFVSLGKGEARKKSHIGQNSQRGKSELVGEKIYRFIDDDFNIEEIPLEYDQADRFLIKLRDESHRFSNYYRKQQMNSELKTAFKNSKK